MKKTIDQLDRRILQELQNNADVTNETLGQRLHVSPATCQRRISRLKKIGVIEKVVAIVNPQTAGEPLIAIVEVTLSSQAEQTLSAFEVKACEFDVVQQCYRTSTGPDLILVMALPDMNGYHEIASSLFTASNEVRNVRTFFSILRSKFGTNIPV